MVKVRIVNKATSVQQRLINEIQRKKTRPDIINWKSGAVFGHFSDYNRKGSIENVKPKLREVFPNCTFAVQEIDKKFALYVDYYNYYTVVKVRK